MLDKINPIGSSRLTAFNSSLSFLFSSCWILSVFIDVNICVMLELLEFFCQFQDVLSLSSPFSFSLPIRFVLVPSISVPKSALSCSMNSLSFGSSAFLTPQTMTFFAFRFDSASSLRTLCKIVLYEGALLLGASIVVVDAWSWFCNCSIAFS